MFVTLNEPSAFSDPSTLNNSLTLNDRSTQDSWAVQLRLDTLTTYTPTPAQFASIRTWIRSLSADSLKRYRWETGRGESIASQIMPAEDVEEEGEERTFHVIILHRQLEQHDHEFRVAVGAQTKGKSRVGGEEDVLVLLELELQKRAMGCWQKRGWSPRGVMWPDGSEILRRLRDQWDAGDEDDDGNGQPDGQSAGSQ